MKHIDSLEQAQSALAQAKLAHSVEDRTLSVDACVLSLRELASPHLNDFSAPNREEIKTVIESVMAQRKEGDDLLTALTDKMFEFLLSRENAAWQPMETAPKDNRIFLVYMPTDTRRPIQTAWQNQNGVMVIGSQFAFDCKKPVAWREVPRLPRHQAQAV